MIGQFAPVSPGKQEPFGTLGQRRDRRGSPDWGRSLAECRLRDVQPRQWIEDIQIKAELARYRIRGFRSAAGTDLGDV